MIRGIVNQRTVKTKTFSNNNVIETIWSRFEHTSFRTADISLHTIRKRTAPASAWVVQFRFRLLNRCFPVHETLTGLLHKQAFNWSFAGFLLQWTTAARLLEHPTTHLRSARRRTANNHARVQTTLTVAWSRVSRNALCLLVTRDWNR